MATMDFTPEQVQALDIDAHLVVEANAGSGKTRVLVERFLRILQKQRVNAIEDIVAITFTTKAAAEMRHRVQRRMQDVLKNDPGSPLAPFLSRMGYARISTFHSFGASLLRKYAGTTGIAAHAPEASLRQLRGIQREALAATVRAWLQNDATTRRMLGTLDEIDIQVFEQVALSLVESGEKRRRLAAHLSFDDDTLAQPLVHNLSLLVTDAVRALEYAQESIERVAPYGDAATEHVLNICYEAYRMLQRTDITLDERLQPACEFLLWLYTKEGTGRKKVKDVPGWTADLPKLPVKPSAIEELLGGGADPMASAYGHIARTRTIAAIADEAAQLYALEKRSRGLMDFDDITVHLQDLLGNHEAAARDIRRNIRFLMVDEFQDTNDVQYDIVKRLAPSDTVNAYVVGDPKQSIYAFRNANVRLFGQAITDITRANEQEGKGQKGHVVLSHSFRMAPALVPVLNDLCEPLFLSSGDGVDYSHLVAGRTTPGDADVGTVTVLDPEIHKQAQDADEDATPGGEFTHIGAWIRSYVLTGRLKVRTADGIRMARAADVAILVRTQATIPTAVGELRAQGIPVQAFGGRAFFSRPEIVDFRALLAWTSDPDDDLAFATLVRSGIVNGTHAFLLECAAASRRSLWAGACTLTGSPIVPMMQTWLAASRVLPPDAVMRMVLEQSEWYRSIAPDERSGQITSNVNKLIGIVREECRRPGATAYDALRAIDIPETDAEAEGTVESDIDVIKLMTIHASKGLEFPIVIVAGMNHRRPYPSWVATGAGTTYRTSRTAVRPDAKGVGEKLGADHIHLANIELADQQDMAERSRMIYVALTRAQDHLVISRPRMLTTKGEEGALGGLATLFWPVLDTLALPRMNAVHTGTAEQGVPPADVRIVDRSAPVAYNPGRDSLSPSDLLPAMERSGEPLAHAEANAEGSGPIYGSFLHDIMRHMLTLTTSGEREAVLETLLNEPLISEGMRLRARSEVSALLASGFLTANAMHLAQARMEVAYVTMLGDTLVEGVMDVLVGTSATSREVWDWKTNNVHGTADIDASAAHYRMQMLAYAWLVLSSDPDIEEVTTRLLYTQGLAKGYANWVQSTTWRRSALDDMTSVLETYAVA